MKVTKRQLKQIIREEIQQEGVFDAIGDFFKGKNKKYVEFMKTADKRRMALGDYDLNDKQAIERDLEELKKLAEENLSFPADTLNSMESKRRDRFAKRLADEIEVTIEDLARLDRLAAEEAQREAEELERERQQSRAEALARARAKTTGRKQAGRTAAERAKIKKDSEDKYYKQYDIKTRDAFSESKITKEDIKQIIREEIKNFKR